MECGSRRAGFDLYFNTGEWAANFLDLNWFEKESDDPGAPGSHSTK
jgi:hypothetical protein